MTNEFITRIGECGRIWTILKIIDRLIEFWSNLKVSVKVIFTEQFYVRESVYFSKNHSWKNYLKLILKFPKRDIFCHWFQGVRYPLEILLFNISSFRWYRSLRFVPSLASKGRPIPVDKLFRFTIHRDRTCVSTRSDISFFRFKTEGTRPTLSDFEGWWKSKSLSRY